MVGWIGLIIEISLVDQIRIRSKCPRIPPTSNLKLFRQNCLKKFYE